MMALYAFCREVDDVVDEYQEREQAQQLLDEWRSEVTRIFDDEAQTLVGQALMPVVKQFQLPQEYFLELIDGMQMDLDQTRYASFKELSLYCYRVASVVGLMTVEIFGYSNKATLRYAHDLGMAMQLTNILRDVKEDVQRGRIYLPQDEMQRFGVTVEDLQAQELSDNLRALFRLQAQRARSYYDKAMQQLPPEDRYSQRSGLIMAAVYRKVLDAIEQQDFPVLKRRLSLSPLHKLWIAWHTARRERRRRQKLQAA